MAIWSLFDSSCFHFDSLFVGSTLDEKQILFEVNVACLFIFTFLSIVMTLLTIIGVDCAI